MWDIQLYNIIIQCYYTLNTISVLISPFFAVKTVVRLRWFLFITQYYTTGYINIHEMRAYSNQSHLIHHNSHWTHLPFFAVKTVVRLRWFLSITQYYTTGYINIHEMRTYSNQSHLIHHNSHWTHHRVLHYCDIPHHHMETCYSHNLQVYDKYFMWIASNEKCKQ